MPDDSNAAAERDLGFSGPHRGYATKREQLCATLAHLVMAADWQAREAHRLAARMDFPTVEREQHRQCAAAWQQLGDDGRYALAQVEATSLDTKALSVSD
ncbi:MAG: hypothetical protein FJX35_03960 [Alphaproteobacteria bacterium]|nr:hypothetical protein [Alphaproteobacteria bacterium]